MDKLQFKCSSRIIG